MDWRVAVVTTQRIMFWSKCIIKIRRNLLGK